jgi:AcrR family transcriptional regulator
MTYSDKQLQIITTAESLFSGRGYDGTSVRDIAEAAGVNVAMISYYFGSKEGLIQALFEERTRDVVVKVENLLKDDTLTPLEKVHWLIDDYVQRIATKIQFHKIMVCEQMLEKNTVISTLLTELKKRNADVISRLIRDGQEKGAFRPDVDLVLLMNTLIGTVTQTFINKDYYRVYNALADLDEEPFQAELKARVSGHLKSLFKAILTYES